MFAVGIVSVLLATPAGVNLLRATVTSLFGSRLMEIRSYRRVFDLERRIYRVDRLRLNPGGIPVRGVVYFLAILAATLIAGRLPLLASVARLLPWYLRDLALPAAKRRSSHDDSRRGPAVSHGGVRPRSLPDRTSMARRRTSMCQPRERGGIPRRSSSCRTAPTAGCVGCTYTGPGAVLVAVEHERAEEAGRRWLGDLSVRHRPALTLWQSSRGPAAHGRSGDRACFGARLLVRSDARGEDEGSEGTDRVRLRQLRLRKRARRLLGRVHGRGRRRIKWLSEDGKRAQFLALLGALEATEADVQILRVGRRWELERYADEVHGVSDIVGSDAESVNGVYDSHARPHCAAHGHAMSRSTASPEGHRQGETGRVPDGQPARPREGRRLLRITGCRAASKGVVGRLQARFLDARQAPAEGLRAGAGTGCAPTRRMHGSRTFFRFARRVGSSCSGWFGGRFAEVLASRFSTSCMSHARSCSSATARRCSRRWRVT